MNHTPLIGALPFTRRCFIQTAMSSAAALGLGVLPEISLASNPTSKELHGLSSFGDLKYASDYPHFDYAVLDAPKGGRFSFQPSYWYFNQNTQTFNTLNSFVLKGEAPPRMENCFDTLMTWAIDEPDSLYCSVAESVEISEDRNSYRFKLRPQARFHDGSKLTSADVVFSYLTIKEKGHPQLAVDLTNLEEVVALDTYEVELRFNGKQSDRAILSIANSVPILSTAFYANLPFEDHVMELPLASGPWKVGKFSAGLFIEYERVDDYWAKDLPFAKGLNHFDVVRIDFFRERQSGFEAFKKGVVRWRQEFTSKTWATEYNFPAVEEGKVVKIELPDEKRPSLQGWAINTRREKFKNPKTREAIGLVFDFEWTNKKLFFGAYQRSNSMFENSAYAARNEPSPAELTLLEPLRDQLPETVFGPAVDQFVSDGSGRDRRALRKAQKLLLEAGWKREDNTYVDAAGNRLEIEILIRAQVFERILGPYAENLRTLGIPTQIRLVDPSQFQARLEDFDFDMVGSAFSMEATPTFEAVKQFFHSDYANQKGSRNYAGVASAPLDALIDGLSAINNRNELEIAMKAIDRVLRAYHYWIPNWFAPNHRIAMWDMFGWKDPKPDYFFPVERLWWVDPEKASAIR